uniref:Polycystin-1-like protein 1 n=1 Tax=Leptobrachium leishanense TaxID=445787 RepID=A0A8C5PCG7_9ANUR
MACAWVRGARVAFPSVFHALRLLTVFIYAGYLAHSMLCWNCVIGELQVDCFNLSFNRKRLLYEGSLPGLSTCSKYCLKKWSDSKCLQHEVGEGSLYCTDVVSLNDNPSKCLANSIVQDVVNERSLKKTSISIFTNGITFSTDTDITFFVVTNVIGPMNFSWDFGDKTNDRTMSRCATKRYSVPNRFAVQVNASNQICSFSSNVHTVFVQQRIIPNRLAANSSVLVNSKVTFNCRINAGTNIIYLWNFGDGMVRLGESSETYTYMREGEFMVNVSLVNNISSAVLTKQIFVVKEPCQPPPVKYMGPQKIQIRRHEDLNLGVTFEGPIQCNISQGLSYYWTLVKVDGYSINLPDHINCGRPRITIPRFFLDYGKHTAISRVQIVGNLVYSNYTVPLEVLPSDPVSIIAGGTHQFLDKSTAMSYTLNGSLSYDPDYPGAHLRFIWNCAPVSIQTLSCFNSSMQNPLQIHNSITTFPFALLDSKFDQYHFTLIVINGNRSSAPAHSFLSIKMHTKLRQIQLICSECRNASANWNERFSVTAFCTYCSEYDPISYVWKLYWINATESKSVEVPFCKVLVRKAPSNLMGGALDNIATQRHRENVISGEQFERTYSLQRSDKNAHTTLNALENEPDTIIPTAIPDLEYINFDKELPSYHLNIMGLPFPLSSMIEDGSSDAKPNGVTKNTLPLTAEFESHIRSIHEGKVGSRRLIEGTLETSETPMHSEGEDLLVDLTNSAVSSSVTVMIDWPRLQISDSTFQNYTLGISSQIITFHPFVLKPSNMYMLDVSLASHGNTIGKSQIYFKVNEIPKSVACQVQPREGFEMYTVFSVFCSSGKEDLQYEFSYQTSASDRKRLYKGWDIQYYFNLPAGEPSDAYRVTIFSQITNSFGSKSQRCPVNVTVLPSFIRNTSVTDLPELELFNESRRNLSTLLLMRNSIAIRNYINLLTKVLNRLYTEENKAAFGLQTKMRNFLISIVCSLTVHDQDIGDVVSLLLDLMKMSKQVTVDSALLITTNAKILLNEYFKPNQILKQMNFTENAVLMITQALDISFQYSETQSVALDGLESIRDLILKYVRLSDQLEINISTNLMELHTKVYKNFTKNTLEVGSIRLNLPQLLDQHRRKKRIPNMTCLVSQLVYFKRQPFVATSSQNYYLNRSLISLSWNKVNYHHFNITPKKNEGVLHLTIRFSTPNVRAFPVLILIRHMKKPTTTHFHGKQIYYWEGNSTQISLTTDSVRDKGSLFLALMDADYNREPKNKYLSRTVNYSIDVHWSTCLYWLGKQWISEDCTPQIQFNCSCLKFSVFTSLRHQVINNTCTENVSQFISADKNLVPCTIVFLSACVYILLGAICKLKDAHEEKKNGFVLLQDNSSNDQQLYAIIVETGFRSRPKSTAKVHIILHGEDGVSETRELYCHDKPLFERNSRSSFIMSIPDAIGPIWKIQIWHDNNGDSPSVYISHIVIKDLMNGNSYFFLAECWLAVDEADGKVERELTSMGHGLGFRKHFYCKFTDYLEDFHFWGSIISRPSYSCFMYTQRLTICFVLLFGYMCFNSIIIQQLEEQYTVELGFLDISVISLKSGIKVTLAMYPLTVLLSLLFRFSKKQWSKDTGEGLMKVGKECQIISTEGHQHYISNIPNECSLNWQYLQYWVSHTWKMKYERDIIPEIQSRNCSKIKNGSPTSSNQCLSGFEDCTSKGFSPALKEMCSEYTSGHNRMFKHSIFNACNVLPPWCTYLAWLFCTVINIISAMVTVFLGFRFGPTKCVLWLHAVFCSFIYCNFIFQPVVTDTFTN